MRPLPTARTLSPIAPVPLPPARPGFVGRVAELAALAAAFGRGARLVTVLGAGGLGKTRLALEYAQRDARDAVFCDVTEARDGDEVCAVVAAQLAVRMPGPGAAGADAVARALAAREPGGLLVILDNFEHVVASAAATVGRWLDAAPSLRVLVTSRERLRIAGERCVELGPLGVPAVEDRGAARVVASEAVQLFVQQARAVRGEFALGDAEADAIAALVRRLEGIPLAIELCAARSGVLGARQLLERVAARLDDVPASHERAGRGRHATLRAAIEWSWNLSSPREQDALQRCAVFHGGWGLEAAAAVLDDAADPIAATEAMQALHDRSLVRAFDAPGLAGERRFGLYESIREFAAERLEASGQGERARDRHAAYYLRAGERWWSSRVGGPDVFEARRRLALESENLLAVCRRGLTPSSATGRARDPDRALRALCALEPVTAGAPGAPLGTYTALLDTALDAAARHPGHDPALHTRGLLARANARLVHGQLDGCVADLQDALVAARALGDAALEIAAEVRLVGLLALRVPLATIGPWLDAALARVGAMGEARHEAMLVLARSVARFREDRAAAARDDAHAALERFRAIGDRHNESMTLAWLGHLAVELGALDECERRGDEALALLGQVTDARLERHVVANRGRVLHGRGDLEGAAAQLAHAVATGRGIDHRWLEGLRLAWLAAVELERGRAVEACEAWRDAAGALREVGDHDSAAAAHAGAALAEASRGAAAFARDELARADALAPTSASARTLVTLARAHAELLLAPGEPSRAAARAAVAEARTPLASLAAAPCDVSDRVRHALRALEAALGSAPAPRAVATLRLGPDARWFQGEGERVDLLRRRSIRLLLLGLVAQHEAASGHALTLEQLFRAGWPGERIREASVANRVYVALSKLRSLGLRGLLLSRDDGFLLDPAVRVEREAR